ncbi:MarR family transcriptional regulator [Brevibacillus borstelensis]|jgi:DNA-binding MarR family transcriptional regulator|uniref:MarR family winged helix-turn-helix transcriptional regulator n=1 Tax=Brevibacillus TaxID=55080 RepID=UPI0004F303DD|nr:MarR family transcriptional regulator [Brevibacillus borstelensis]KKX56560.1 transcriptional regulator [Brevibacillus borstelensis cifa_chp40]MCC0562827.1 MarR family transcriptional regulator [Brevibacillus borstelensis]MCM3468708.1 MarR family transcriptional regulator [Brevibacillus borstelensis]MCM3621782.1 MarR family transcriptional regulator [Brevibacillus borstelensis]MED1853041.1 MarR family transcriptional regulator [Brevibacillus borstelensis]
MERIEDCFGFLLGKAYQKVFQLEKARLSEYGVTPVQFVLLHVLWEKDGQKGVELGSRLRLDGATITGLLDRLEQMGLIERRPSPTDRRTNLIYLTPRGRELEKPLNEISDEVNREAMSIFREEELAMLKSMLTRLGLEKEA